ncbi:probable disease resistance protein At4g33300 isoform X2 [Cryptomeria japonica]|uniref:probable disease resistance protein At4g33300 isoform X2 n=1 Tax=Cryptomeria japonica TaxID=3369 RepID=UPI0027DAB185|nr:probable disease resistance protein At4g33300 isoform X2 [Cryptomeria japonica]
MSGVEGALIGVVFQEASTVLKKGVPYIIRVFSNAACKKLKEILSRLKPIVDEMCELSLKSSSEKWLMSIQEFQGNLADGLRLVEECEKTSCSRIHKKFKYANKIQNLEKLIRNFINNILLPNMALNIIKLPDYSCQMKNLSDDVKNVASTIDAHLHEHSSIRRTIIENSGANVEQQERSLCVPNTQNYLVGIDEFLMELKELVLDTEVSVVGIAGLSGIGKSTLASALCHHDQIKEHFRKIIYIPVSKSPNIIGILTDMWERIVGVPKSGFSNYEVSHNQLQCYIDSSRNQPTLVVLDDVCSESDLQKLLFRGEQYKTLVTTRDERILRQGEPKARLYQLPLLQEKDALSLFCHCAFGEPKIPTTHDRDLVIKVQEECKGLPVALQVIGRSLRDRDPMFWRSAKNKLSRGETISSYHEDLNERLKMACIDELEDNEKQCFLDLAAFPEGRTISANALLDIWVYVRGMDWDNAFVLLWEFADRGLVTLKRDPWTIRSTAVGCACLKSVTTFLQSGKKFII